MKIKNGDFAWSLGDDFSFHIQNYYEDGTAWIMKQESRYYLVYPVVKEEVLKSKIIKELFLTGLDK